MSLTFRSSIAELVQITIRDSDGSTRVARLQRDSGNPRNWTGSVDHPNQRFEVATFDPDVVGALGKLAEAMASREVDFRQSKARGYRASPKTFDYSRQLHDGHDAAPIVGIPSNRR
jgi:hypothetical protein